MSEVTDDEPQASRHLLYFADPMCSWCWGSSPAIDKIREAIDDGVEIRTVMGGLRPGTTDPWNERGRGEIRDHWEHVHEASGQPFDFGLFERDDFIYDTEPACRAVVTVRRLDATKTLAMLKAVHHAFYAENRDVTAKDELVRIAGEQGLDKAAFAVAFDNAETVTETQGDFWLSQASGVTGFPTLLAVEDGQAQIVTLGYRRWEDLVPAVKAWADAG